MTAVKPQLCVMKDFMQSEKPGNASLRVNGTKPEKQELTMKRREGAPPTPCGKKELG